MKTALLIKEFEFEATVDVSVWDILDQLSEEEKHALAKELAEHVSKQEVEEIKLSKMSLEDEYKLKHFKSKMGSYTLAEIEELL